MPPKLMKSTKLVSTCERSEVLHGWERASHVEHTHCGMYGCDIVAAQLLQQLLLYDRAIFLPLDSLTSFLVSAIISYQ